MTIETHWDNSIQLEVISIDEIIIDTENRREINEEKVNELVKSISEIGLLHPIIITTKKELIAGFHRLEAYRKLNHKKIPCKIVDESEINQLLLKLIRLDENLVRYEGHFFDRGRAFLERKEIYEELYPETKQGMKGGWHNNKSTNLENDTVSLSSFSQDTANKTGISSRTIEREIQLYRDIIPEVQEFIKEQEIGKKEALLIAREDKEKQIQIIEKLANGNIKVEAAIAKIEREETTAQAIDKIRKKTISDLEIFESLGLTPKLYNRWSFSGCIEGIGIEFPGRMAGQIALNLLYYYTRQKDVVVDLMAGGGTIHDACKIMKRKCYSFDIKPIREFIIQKDITEEFPSTEVSQAKLVFFDPPYWRQKRGDYSKHENNLANLRLEEFYKVIEKIFKCSAEAMSSGSYFVFIHNNTTQLDTQFHVFEFMKLLEKYFKLIAWIDVPYPTQQYLPQQVIKAKNERRLLDITRYLLVWRKE